MVLRRTQQGCSQTGTRESPRVAPSSRDLANSALRLIAETEINEVILTLGTQCLSGLQYRHCTTGVGNDYNYSNPGTVRNANATDRYDRVKSGNTLVAIYGVGAALWENGIRVCIPVGTVCKASRRQC